MLIFFDTEFTELGANPRLISIGFVSEDGQREFYAELSNTYQIADCSDFVRESVLPQLQGGSTLMSVRELAVKCVFQTKLDGQSTANWTLIPEQTGH